MLEIGQKVRIKDPKGTVTGTITAASNWEYIVGLSSEIYYKVNCLQWPFPVWFTGSQLEVIEKQEYWKSKEKT